MLWGQMNRMAIGILLTTAFWQAPASRADVRWIPIDGEEPGTPAEIMVDEGSSGPEQTVVHLKIHGFWMEDKEGPNATYQKIVVPGLGSVDMDQLGAPDLPRLRLKLAIPSDAAAVRLADVEIEEEFGLDGVLVWPQPIDERDHEEGDPEIFQRDDALYRLDTPWPPEPGLPSVEVGRQLGLPSASCECYPCRWNPSTRELRIASRVRYVFVHPGEAQTSPPLTRDRIRLAQLCFLNWPAIHDLFPGNWVFYDSEFLFVYPEAYADEMQPLVAQKWARGFHVSIRTTESIGVSCSQFRAAISDWYDSTPWWRDHYCLLVGDESVIPLCTSPTGVPTDDLYATVNGDDLEEEIYLGRLSVDDEPDAASQVEKILDYEDHPFLFASHYDDALLVAHKENAPGKYVGAHESVRTASYSVPPVFHTLYGHQAGATDAAVRDAINDGMGLVAYRGHGSSTAWTGWNLSSEYFNTTDVNSLVNGSRTPVVWSFACTNSSLSNSDCIAETWLEHAEGGAVSHYGSTVASYTDQNHELDRRMFKAVYDLGLTTQSHAIEYAEAQMAALVGSSNAWMYLLNGDPDMQIRRRNPNNWQLQVPELVNTCPFGNCLLEILVLDQFGDPLPNVLVGAWKPGEAREEAEVFDNRYTEADGWARVPAEPTTPGWLYYTIQDDFGNAVFDSIQVVATGDVDEDVATALHIEARPAVTSSSSSLSFGRALNDDGRVTLFDVAGRSVRALHASRGATAVDWDGADAGGHRVAPGVYLARLSAGAQESTTQIVVMR